jgi:hypothetical protein
VGTRASRLVPSKTLGVLVHRFLVVYVLRIVLSRRTQLLQLYRRTASAMRLRSCVGDSFRSPIALTAVPRSLREPACDKLPPCPGFEILEYWLCLLCDYPARSCTKTECRHGSSVLYGKQLFEGRFSIS